MSSRKELRKRRRPRHRPEGVRDVNDDLKPWWAAIDQRPGDMVVLGQMADYLEERGHQWAEVIRWAYVMGKYPYEQWNAKVNRETMREETVHRYSWMFRGTSGHYDLPKVFGISVRKSGWRAANYTKPSRAYQFGICERWPKSEWALESLRGGMFKHMEAVCAPSA